MGGEATKGVKKRGKSALLKGAQEERERGVLLREDRPFLRGGEGGLVRARLKQQSGPWERMVWWKEGVSCVPRPKDPGRERVLEGGAWMGFNKNKGRKSRKNGTSTGMFQKRFQR